MLIFIIIAAVLLVVDIATKILFSSKVFTLVPGLLSIDPVKNYGAAFGIFQNERVLLIIFTCLILAAGIVAYVRFKQGRQSKLFNIGCAFALSGAVGNLYDRIFLGYVRDFIRFDFLNFINFPICNLADVALNIGMVLLIIYFVFIFKGKQNAV